MCCESLSFTDSAAASCSSTAWAQESVAIVGKFRLFTLLWKGLKCKASSNRRVNNVSATAIHDGVPKVMLGLCAAVLLARLEYRSQRTKVPLGLTYVLSYINETFTQCKDVLFQQKKKKKRKWIKDLNTSNCDTFVRKRLTPLTAYNNKVITVDGAKIHLHEILHPFFQIIYHIVYIHTAKEGSWLK